METGAQKSHLPERMLTVREVASIFNVHPNTVRRWEKKRLLTSYRVGPRSNLRFRREDVLDLLNSSRNE